ncbi:MAG TPA: hypothetical protein VIM84_15465 [Gemmatimonadales bacterium]
MSHPNWSPEQWVFVIGGALSAIGTLITTVIHALASRQRAIENREQNREILTQVSEVKGKIEGTGDGGLK